MDEQELRSIVYLEWRLGRAFLFCAREACKFLIRGTSQGVKCHLRQLHCRRTSDEIGRLIKALDDRGALEPDNGNISIIWLHNFKVSEPIEPFPFLHTIIDEHYGCVYCAHAVKPVNKMKDHYKQEHPGQEITLRYCKVQSLQVGRRFRYLQVKGTTPVVRATATSLLARHANDEQHVDNVVSAVSHNREPNNWLERMGFSVHLEGYDLGLVASLADPLNNSPELSSAVSHLRAVCLRAANRLAADAISNETLLKQLNRRNSSDTTLQTFNWRIQNQTMVKYINSWNHILSYTERIYSWSHPSEPPCQLTENQRVAFANVVSLDWEGASDEEKDAVVFDLIWHISNHRLRRSPFESVLVSACAVLAVDPRNHSWRTSFSYNSTHFSAIIKILLFVIYMRGATAVDDQDRDKSKPSWTNMETRIPRFVDDLDAITKSMDGVVYVRNADSHTTPVTWTTRAQLISKDARMGNARPPVVEWESDGHLRLIAGGGMTTSRRSLSKLMLTATLDAEESLCTLLFQLPGADAADPALDALVPDLSRIRDDRSNLTLGYSFLRHPANRSWASDASTYLTSKIDAHTDLHRHWFIGNAVNADAAKTYESQRKKFMSKLAVAIHLNAGQPSRRTEQQILRWQNSLHGGMRNIFVCNGRVGLRSIWYKRRWTAKNEVPIWRFLPPSLSRLVVLYLSVVLPFSKCLHRSFSNKGNPSCFLYANNVMHSDTKEKKLIDEDSLLSRPFSGLCRRTLDSKLTVAQYRHVAIAYARRFMHNQSIEVILGLDLADDDDGDQQPSTTERDRAEVTHAQAAHSAQIADMVYAVEFDSGEKFNKFLEASLYWHALFDLSSDRPGGDNPDVAPKVRLGIDERVSRLSLLPDLATEKTLRRILSRADDVRLRQRRTRLFDAVEKHRKVVYVIGNEASASVAFDPLSYLHVGGCTVIIQLTKISQERTRARLTAQGLSTLIWDSRSASTPAAVVLVTPDDTRKREWRGFLHRQRAHLCVDLVVLDEAHEALLARREWRSRFLDLAVEMDAICAQQVFVVGILPPSLQSEFFSRLNLRNKGETPYILRSQIVKDNIRYEYIDADPAVGIPPVVYDMTSRAARERRRAIVVSLSHDVCDAVCTTLDVPKYSQQMPPLEQERSFSQWRAERGVLSATVPLTDHIDYQDVSLIICLGAFDYLSLCQQFAWAGKDGQLAVVVLVANLSQLSGEVRAFATSRCNREAISLYLDGKPQTCGLHQNPCQGCSSIIG
ncbi:hypothetical protein F4776DRAFT_677108 [Hypoxylon sp. NC0597]|nr:hypothetical protein F4776DRAFT_677108 [Hypoxylon sp. NC0597]